MRVRRAKQEAARVLLGPAIGAQSELDSARSMFVEEKRAASPAQIVLEEVAA
jgi:hypothetical protein